MDFIYSQIIIVALSFVIKIIKQIFLNKTYDCLEFNEFRLGIVTDVKAWFATIIKHYDQIKEKALGIEIIKKQKEEQKKLIFKTSIHQTVNRTKKINKYRMKNKDEHRGGSADKAKICNEQFYFKLVPKTFLTFKLS